MILKITFFGFVFVFSSYKDNNISKVEHWKQLDAQSLNEKGRVWTEIYDADN